MSDTMRTQLDTTPATINLALSLLSHRKHCDGCHKDIQTAMAALEGVPYEVLIREAG